jgi:hypothetical protein
MADYLFQVRLQGTSNLPKDVYENVLCYSVDGPDTVKGTCDELAALYAGSATGQATMIGGINSVTVRAYPLAGGQPIEESTLPSSKVSLAFPHEVAVCLSYATVDDIAASTPRRRGRIYLGPMGTTGGETARPASALRNLVLAFGQSLASVGFGANTTWKLYSRSDVATFKIESIWCDDAWDTQRRRGLAPTLRTSQDVQ